MAVVVPDEEVMTAWAAKNGKAGRSMAELCADPVSVVESNEVAI